MIFAEGQAMRRISMTMAEWVKKLDGFLTLNDRNILDHAGQIAHQLAKQFAEQAYDKFNRRRLLDDAKLADMSDFEQLATSVGKIEKLTDK